MPNLDDEQFEIYLKKFRPLEPAPFPAEVVIGPRRRRLTLAACALAVAAPLALGIVLLHSRANRVVPAGGTASPPTAEYRLISQPLTLGAANQLLANSASLEATLDSLETESDVSAVPKGKESALGVLREEK